LQSEAAQELPALQECAADGLQLLLLLLLKGAVAAATAQPAPAASAQPCLALHPRLLGISLLAPLLQLCLQ
jgi:hypothetical protein